ncbi:MAG: GAF domain-containing protein, partial [Chloroflexi bacterium]|nr:GAF domain-containing protein [Chloroflexota bacterium]
MALSNPRLLIPEIDQAFSSMPELDPILHSALAQMQGAVSSEGALLWILDEAETELKCIHAVGPRRREMVGIKTRAKKFIEAYRTVSIGGAKHDHSHQSRWMKTDVYRNHMGARFQSVVSVPLMARGKLIGEVDVFNKIDKPAFTQEDRDFIGELAGRIALAIQNTRLFESYNRTVERQKLLSHVSSHLHETLDIDTLIPHIFREVNKAINAEAQSIWFVDEAAGA